MACGYPLENNNSKKGLGIFYLILRFNFYFKLTSVRHLVPKSKLYFIFYCK